MSTGGLAVFRSIIHNMLAQVFICSNSAEISSQALQILGKYQLVQNHADVLWLEGEKLGVEQAKTIREFLSLKPYQANLRAVVVIDAHNFTPDAQNALLKTLEDPAGEHLVIFGISHEDALLPTILSRCQITHLKGSGDQRENKYDKKIEELLNSPQDKRFQIIEKIDDKKAFLTALTAYCREQALRNPTTEHTKLLKDLVQAEQWAKQNVTIRAVLEYLALNF